MTDQNHHSSLGSAAIDRTQANLTRTQTQHDSPSVQEPATTSRWKLRIEAAIWRCLMEFGMVLHRIAPPIPPYPSSRLRIPSTISSHKGHIGLYIYTPPSLRAEDRLPCILNFHGGGFTIGKATDDARWAAAVVNQVPAIFVSVDYRLAPAHPYPTPVQDGVDALLYIHAHADELNIDTAKIAISGFSAGGNMVLTVPLLLKELQRRQAALGMDQDSFTTTAAVPSGEQEPDHINPAHAASQLQPIPQSLRPIALVASYPSLDFSQSRADRRATNTRQELEMPQFLHTLFDSSYLHGDLDVLSPFLSPARASDQDLLEGLPRKVAIYAAEWDGLSKEAMAFGERLKALGLDVTARVLEGTTHGWDRSPNPLYLHKLLDAGYRDACKFLRDVFELDLPAHLVQDAEGPVSKQMVDKVPGGTNTELEGTSAERRTMESTARHLALGGDPSSPLSVEAEQKKEEGAALQGFPGPPASAPPVSSSSSTSFPRMNAGPISAPAVQQNAENEEEGEKSNILDKARRALSRSEEDEDNSGKSGSKILSPVVKAFSVPTARLEGEEEDGGVHGAEEGTVVGPGKVVATKAERGEAMVLEVVHEDQDRQREGAGTA
ncbi:hypothetical protein CF327_g4369 [Tilletia walkeri]|uniref:Alpha/beta hydrolase fold-3 domain-containing protein n=1 Tax=Tilletia walkeri TaxID=117179 RepID=A0A8X7NCT8_9BASI|nr:hypothetical protein CF327_g4369 [Tilletia walkeri]KAE8269646.1 hypothetical protein A4X09_0g2691 [Tilletia walkeri]